MPILDTRCLFATDGGWRDYYVAILEPSTSYQQQIDPAIQQGPAPAPPAGGTLETTVVFQVQEGLSRAVGLMPDGKFHP